MIERKVEKNLTLIRDFLPISNAQSVKETIKYMINVCISMVNWEEVEAEIKKGKADKPNIKCTPNEMMELKNEISELKQKLNMEKDKVDELNGVIKDLTNQMEEAKLSKSAKADKEISSLKSQLEALKNEADMKDKRCKELEQQIQMAGNQVQQFSKGIEMVQTECAELTEKLNASLAENATLKQQLEITKKSAGDVGSLQNKIAQLEAERNGLQQKLQQADTQIASLKAQAAQPQGIDVAEITKRDQQIQQLSNMIGTLKAELAKAKAGADAQPMPMPIPMAQPQPQPQPQAMARQPNPMPQAQPMGAPSMGPQGQAMPIGGNRPQGVRITCPSCGSPKVKEVEDKSNIISFIPKPIYGTKFRCMDCTNEWV